MSQKVQPTWRDLLTFIQEQVAKEGESFLDDRLFIEMQDPETVNKSFEVVEGAEGWKYSEPAWSCNGKVHVFTTHFKDKKIRTLNINF